MSDNDKPTCSICGGEGAVTAFGSYESADGTQPCQACNGTGKRIAELEAALAAAQAEITRLRDETQAMVGRLNVKIAFWERYEIYSDNAVVVDTYQRAAASLRMVLAEAAIIGQPQEITTMRFLCPVCRKAAASSDDANLCCAYDIPQEAISGEGEK